MKLKKSLTVISVAALLTLGSVASLSFADETPLPGTSGKPLTPQQEAVRIGQAQLNKNIDNFNNLGELISEEVKLHEENGFKLGGLNFSTDDGTTHINYKLSQDVLHKETYQKDANGQLKKTDEQDLPSFDPTNKTKFSKLTPGLLKVLNSIPMHKKSPNVNSHIAHASTATAYDSDQTTSTLSMWQDMYYFGSGYHDVDISTHNTWTGTGCACADPGPRDGMDVEWNPNNLYMGSVVWQPNTPTSAGAFGWSGIHDIAIDQSTQHYGVEGGYYVEPDNNSKTNYVEVYLYPVSSSVYGQTNNYYGNYIHTWNYFGGSSISFNIGYKAFGISYYPPLSGNFRINNWGTYTI
jgi:hypothetical protein